MRNGKIALYPTSMARTSPFFPSNRNSINDELINCVIMSSWGSIETTGPKLLVQDLSVLLSLLYICRYERGREFGEKFETSIHEVCKVKGVNKSQNAYRSIRRSIRRLMSTILMTYENIGVGEVMWKSEALLSGSVRRIEKTGKILGLRLKLAENFCEVIASNMFTPIDVGEFNSIKGDVSKLIWSFLKTQNKFYKGKEVTYGCDTLASVSNLIDFCEGGDCASVKVDKAVRKSVKRGLENLKKGMLIDFEYDNGKDSFAIKKLH